MPPQGIDMSLIQEALARRAAGGGGTPAMSQVSRPVGGSPLQAPPQVAPTGALGGQGAAPRPQTGAPAPAGQGQAQGQGQRGQAAVNFDDDTKVEAKALIARLMKYL